MTTTETQSEFKFTPMPPSREGEQMELDFSPRIQPGQLSIAEATAAMEICKNEK